MKKEKTKASQATEAQLLEEYGWFIGKRIGLTDLNFTPAQIDLVLRGITLASQDKPSPNEVEKIGPAMDTFIKAKQNDYLAKVRAKGLAEIVINYKHVLRNALILVLTTAGLQFGALIGTIPWAVLGGLAIVLFDLIAATLPHVAAGNYGGEHWLASFAVYLLSTP